MGFLAPAFLLGAIAIAIPIVLHLLRRDVAPELPFTAVRLLKKSPVERSRRRRLRDLVLLAARITALLLLAAAFARPVAPSAGAAALPLRIVAVDRSFSMGAGDAFERAREAARQAIDEAGFGERVALIAFDERAEVVAAPGPAGEAREALARIGAGFGGTRYATLLAKASELAAGSGARLVVITDLQRTGWEGESRVTIPSALELEIRGIEAAGANLAVTAVRVEGDRVIGTVRNSSPDARSGELLLEHDGREVAGAPFTAPPGESLEVAIPWKPVDGGVAVTVNDPEGFPADDRRFALAGPASAPSVLVVTSPESSGFYLQRALEAAEAGDPMPLIPQRVSPAEIAGGRAAKLATHRALVVLATRGLDQQAREGIVAFVRAGGGLLVAASPDVEPEVLAAMFGWDVPALGADAAPRQASLAATDVRHPILRPFGGISANLGQVRFSRAWLVSPAGWHIVARFDDGSPALLDRRAGEGRIVLFASDLDRRWNDFPLHPAFVPFVAETLRYVAIRGGEPTEYLAGRTPAGVPAEPGVHRLGSGRTIVVNVDSRESGTAVMTQDEFRAMVEPVDGMAPDSQAQLEQAEARQSLWQYGLLLMLGVLVVESMVGRA